MRSAPFKRPLSETVQAALSVGRRVFLQVDNGDQSGEASR